MRDLMIDIETLGTHTSNSVILSVGAVPFSFDPTPKFGDEFLWVLNVAPQIVDGRQIDVLTRKWWADQSEDARRHWEVPKLFIHPRQLRQALFDAINSFSSTNEVVVWANGDRFDIGNLEDLMWSYAPGEAMPWKYNSIMDYRTITRYMPLSGTMPENLSFESHDPIEDCKKQIWRLWERLPNLTQVAK